MPNSLLEIAQLRETFSRVTGKLIESYYEFDRERAAAFQAGLVALKIKLGRDFNAFTVRDEADLTVKLAESQITSDELDGARVDVDLQDSGGVLKDVPPFGDIAVKLGMVKMTSKDLLIKAQAAVRTLDFIEATLFNSHGDQNLRLNAIVYDLRAQKDETPVFARGFIGNRSPKDLTQAQALNHLTEIVGKIMSVTKYKSSRLLHSLELLAFDSLASAKTDSQNVETIGSAPLNRDLTILHDRLEYKLNNFPESDITITAERGLKLELLEAEIGKMFGYLKAESLQIIEGAKLDEIRMLVENRL